MHRGHIYTMVGRATYQNASDHLLDLPDGGLLVDANGVIEWVGAWDHRPAGDYQIIHHSGSFILPGFIDTHMHFPQVYSASAYGGGQLLEWLEKCIFPGEARLGDPAFGRQAAQDWVNMLVRSGTTLSLVFGSQFPDAQDAVFAEYQDRGLRGIIGRCIQTTGPESSLPLQTSEEDAIRLTREELEKWHPDPHERDNALTYCAIVPRFSLSVSRDTLRALGDLYDEWRPAGVYFTSHLNENNRPGDGEVDTVKRIYEVNDYLDTYDGKFLPGSKEGGSSLLGRRSVMAHSVWCSDTELARMAETGTSIAHCPNSQLFLGSGTMPWLRTIKSGVNVAAGTDYAGGDNMNIPYVLSMAFKQHMGETTSAHSMHPAELLLLGTLSGARALDMEVRTGSLEVGKAADFVVVDPSRTPTMDVTLNNLVDTGDLQSESLLFTLLLQMTEPSIAGTFVQGKKLEVRGS